MTSLIGWGIYLGHQGVVKHRREKQRVKNYERWEGLRDEYDDQKRVQRESRSLDIQRTGMTGIFDNGSSTGVGGYTNGYGYEAEDKGIITLRDQQEANDARMGWRPQESWETGEEKVLREQRTGYGPMTPHGRLEQRRSMDVDRLYANHTAAKVHRPEEHRAVSMATGYDQIAMTQRDQGLAKENGVKRLSVQKTGAVWDEGLPPRLAVTRRNWDDGGQGNQNGSQRTSLQPSPQPSDHGSKAASYESSVRGDEKGRDREREREESEVVESHVPGGFMATLIEGRENHGQGQGQRSVQSVQRSNNPFEHQQPTLVNNSMDVFTPPPSNGMKSNNPFENMESGGAGKIIGYGNGNGLLTPVGEKDMMEWWK